MRERTENIITAILLGATTALVVFSWVSIASAAGPDSCGQRADVLGQLREKYGEVSVAQATNSDKDILIELYRSEGGETWTLLGTSEGGVTCLLAAGKDWTDAVPAFFPSEGEEM